MSAASSKLSQNKWRIKFIVFNGIAAALYVVFTAPFASIAYGPIQVRIAEVMAVFPVFTWGMISVAASEALLMIVLGIPLILVMEKTGLKNKLP